MHYINVQNLWLQPVPIEDVYLFEIHETRRKGSCQKHTLNKVGGDRPGSTILAHINNFGSAQENTPVSTDEHINMFLLRMEQWFMTAMQNGRSTSTGLLTFAPPSGSLLRSRSLLLWTSMLGITMEQCSTISLTMTAVANTSDVGELWSSLHDNAHVPLTDTLSTTSWPLDLSLSEQR